MDEADGLGVPGLTGADGKAVVHELPVLTEHGPFDDLIAAIGFVVEEGMTDMLHVHPDLVGTAGFEDALYEGDIAEAFQDLIVGDGFLAMFPFGIGVEELAETLVTAYMGHDRSGLFL